MSEPLGPYPTMENVAHEVFFCILWKILSAEKTGGYVCLEYNDITLDLHAEMTDEELEVLRRIAAHIDGSGSAG
jgi:hypothetical protein